MVNRKEIIHVVVLFVQKVKDDLNLVTKKSNMYRLVIDRNQHFKPSGPRSD